MQIQSCPSQQLKILNLFQHQLEVQNLISLSSTLGIGDSSRGKNPSPLWTCGSKQVICYQSSVVGQALERHCILAGRGGKEKEGLGLKQVWKEGKFH